MRRRKRENRQQQQQQQLHNQQSNIIFDLEMQSNKMCFLCHNFGDLMSPCECSTKCHQRCLLMFIQGLTRRALKRKQSIDLSMIKCQSCKNNYHIVFSYKSEYSWQAMVRRMSVDCCNNHIIMIAMVFVLLIITVAIFISNISHFANASNNKLFIGLVTALALEALLLLVLISHFLHKYLTKMYLYLERVLEMIDVRSMGSSSSDENKIQEECEIIVIN